MPGLGNVLRVPRLRRRLGRDIERLSDEGNIVDVDGAVRLSADGKITLYLGTDGFLNQTGALLNFDDERLYLFTETYSQMGWSSL